MNQPPIILYGNRQSQPTARVALYLSMAGIPYEFRKVDLRDGARPPPEIQSRGHFGMVPVLVQGNTTLAVSMVILTWLAEQTGQFGAVEPEERWQIAEWMGWIADGLLALQRSRAARVLNWDASVMSWWDGRSMTALGILDGALKHSTFLVGGRPTIADIAAFPLIDLIDEAGITLADWPAVGVWYARMLALPGCRRHYDLLPE